MFTPHSEAAGARLGTLRVDGKEPIETPALLVHTLAGSLPSVSPELAAEIKGWRDIFGFLALYFTFQVQLTLFFVSDFRLAAVDLSEVLDYQSAFFAIPEETVTFLGLTCSLSSPLGVASTKGVVLETVNGRKEATPATLQSACSRLKPGMVMCLSDEVPFRSRRKRVAKSVDRNLQWLKSHLEAESGAEVLLPVLGGGSDVSVREKCAKDAVAALEQNARGCSDSGASGQQQKQPLHGAVIGGLGSGESREERREAVAASLRHLPCSMLRVASQGYQSPSDILDAVASGVDVIGTPLPYFLTRNGQALALPLSHAASSLSQEEEAEAPCTIIPPLKKPRAGSHDGASSLPTKHQVSTQEVAVEAGGDEKEEEEKSHVLNLIDSRHRKDTRPLVDGCTCHACSHHSRAYIHHLLVMRRPTSLFFLMLCRCVFCPLRTTHPVLRCLSRTARP